MSVIDYFRPKTKAKLLAGEYVHWVENNERSGDIKQCVLSFPDWVSKEELQAIWLECRRLEHKTGIPHQLDHIIPLKHPKVSGLTVPWNLQPLPADENFRKNNSCPEVAPHQIDIFKELL